jgi:hypothetical protein
MWAMGAYCSNASNTSGSPSLAIYVAVKHFGHMLETPHFIIFIDNKPTTYAFQQKRKK